MHAGHRRNLGFVIFFTLCVFSGVVFAGGMDEDAAIRKFELAPLVQQLSDRFFEGTLTVADLESQLSATSEPSDNKEAWLIKSDKYHVRASARARSKSAALQELQLYPNDTNQLELHDLEKLFGKWRELMRSRNTWVEFDSRKTKNNASVRITAQLYSPPESAVSPVITVKLRVE